MEIVQNYYNEEFDCGQIGRVEVLPVTVNSVDILKMKEISKSIKENTDLEKSFEYQDIIMKTAFYCNHEFYQVRQLQTDRTLKFFTCYFFIAENYEPYCIQPQ